MQRSLINHPWLILFINCFIFLFFTGCNQTTQTATATSTEIVLPATATHTAVPSETPQPPLVVLYAPSSSDPVLTESLQNLLSDRSAQAGLRFQVLHTLSETDFLAQTVRVIFALPPDPGIVALAAANTQTQFVAIGIPGIQPSGNINLVGASINRPDQAGFLAGVMAAVTTQDFRAAVIYPAEAAVGKAARRGFSKGVSFYCGLCQPVHPPYPPTNYPLFYELPASASQTDWDAAIEYFTVWQAQTVYITPDLVDPDLDDYLAKAGFEIIDQEIPAEDIKGQWIASLGAGDPIQAISTHWEDFLSGNGGLSIELPLSIAYVNESFLSPGKLQYINDVLSDLQQDFIDTGVDPVTGEWR